MGVNVIAREISRGKRHARVRQKIVGSAARPRLSVFRSQQHIFAQLIDDSVGRTLASASTIDPALRKSLKSGSNKAAATAVGKLLAERAKAANIRKVVFDRGGYLYHGRVKALADGAREAGLDF